MNRRAWLVNTLLLVIAVGAAMGIIAVLISAVHPGTSSGVMIVTATPANAWWTGHLFEPLPTPTFNPLVSVTPAPSAIPPLNAPPTIATRVAEAPTLVFRTLTPTSIPSLTPSQTPTPPPVAAVALAPKSSVPQPPRTGFRLTIPKLKLDLGVDRARFTGTTWDFNPITTQAAHLDGLALPGTANNVVIGAHSELTKRRPGPFYRLNRLQPGDEIVIGYGGQDFRYRVDRMWIVVPTDISPIQQGIGDVLTLLTCDGYNRATSGYDTRLIVRASRIG